jgi:hypothetical protein
MLDVSNIQAEVDKKNWSLQEIEIKQLNTALRVT